MRSGLRQIPIKQKLILVSMLTTGVALSLACSALFCYEYITYRDTLSRELVTLGKIIAANSTASVNFQFREDAAETLSTLGAERHIVAAAIFLKDGTRLAEYQRSERPGALPESPLPDGHYFQHEHLNYFGPVFDERTSLRIGTLFLRSDCSGIWERLQLYAAVLLLVLLACVVVAFVLSTRLQRLISEPVLALAQAARIVSERKDYSVRADKRSGDELGQFTDAFNQMLAQIQEQDTQLRQAKEQLERRVEERTQELQIEIVERKRTEQHLAQQAKELARSNAELEQFAYVASHDLQEPLRMVANFTQLLARRYEKQLDAEAHEFIGFAVDGAMRMQTLINDLLEYSRVSRRGKPFVLFESGEALEQAIFNLSNSMKESDASVTSENLPAVRGDSGQLVQLFQNLISNAIKFRGNQRPEVQISAGQQNDEWLFAVKDNGIGIDPRYAERIFVIFQRLHGYAEYPGTGIGLAICKRIVERHGGRIWVDSKLGAGSTFYFTIAMKRGAAQDETMPENHAD